MKGVPELVQFQKSPLVLGGGMSLTSVIEILDEVSATNANYKYTKTIADHIRKVAHPSVRNAGTIAGNLMLKHAYPGNSDFFSVYTIISRNFCYLKKTFFTKIS